MGFVLPGDFNGTGRSDFIILAEDSIKYLQNTGGRNFSYITLPNLELAYVGDPIVSDLSPVYSKFADVSGDGLGDLVVLEKFTDSSGKIIPRIRYFQGILSNDIFAPAQQLNANINHDDFHFDRFELADLDQDFDLDLILPLKNRETGLSGKIVWYENLGDAQFSSEKIILQISNPKFVIGFNFASSDYPAKNYIKTGLEEFNYQDLLWGVARNCIWQSLLMERSK